MKDQKDHKDLIEMVENIGKAVRCPLLDNCVGKILGVYIDIGEAAYQTQYFYQGDRKTCYFKSDEVRLIEV